MPKEKQSQFIAFKKQLVESRMKIVLPFILFVIASIVFVLLTPVIVGISGSKPALWQIASTGIIVIILSSLFITWASRILKLQAMWAILMTLFLACIAIVKFILVPQSLYSQEFQVARGGLGWGFDPNASGGYVYISIFTAVIYLLVLWVYYRVYRRKVFIATNLLATNPKDVERKRTPAQLVGFLVFVLIVVTLIVFSAQALLIIPLLFAGSFMQYLGFIFNNGGVMLLLFLVLAIIFAFKAVQVSAKQSIDMKKPTIIAICIWIALSVLLLYQIIWIVYMTVLVSLAPFKVIYFSSK